MPSLLPSPHNLTHLLRSAVRSLAEGQLHTASVCLGARKSDALDIVDNTSDLPFTAAAQLPRFQVGDVINSRYEVLAHLGEGSMGVVYRVRDQLFPNRRIALKTLQRLTEPEWLTLFRAEFRALAELQHTHIAQVYDFEELSNQAGHLFTMEFVEGQVLDSALASRDPHLVWRAVTDMAEALAYVHSHGRLHLDIKPQNAILAPDGTCKLLDFGLVGLVFTPGQFAGTPLYMAPEILKEQVPDARCDLFSLGITAYQLLTGRIPYSHTTRIHDLFAEKLDRVVEFPAEFFPRIPAFMRQAVVKLCALQPDLRFASAKDFLHATRGEASLSGIITSRAAHRLERSTFVGREQELNQVLDFARARLAPSSVPAGAMICCVSAISGMGKSRLLAEVRTLLQSEGHVFLQGDAYDRDVGEYTALAPILLAASHLAHAQGAVDLTHRHGPELVKIVPEFGLPIVCTPSLAFSNGEAERERLIFQAAAFLVELAQRRPLVVYVNDLQWARAGTVGVLRQILKQLEACSNARLALLISYRSDQTSGQPIEVLLEQLSEKGGKLIQLHGLSAEQVSLVMGSMLLAKVSFEIASQIQQATGGIPFLVEESTRWLLSQDALAVRNGVCEVNTETGQLDLHMEVGKGIVTRAALQGEHALLCLKLLSVCARPIELEHLRHAMAGGNTILAEDAKTSPDLNQVLLSLEAEQWVIPVAGNRPRYALIHDRIRESLFAALASDECSELHGRLGAAFEAFLLTTQTSEFAVLAAVHQNATPIPMGLSARIRRCDVNLRAAEVARQAADFAQALTFLDAAEALLAPDIWANHARGMRLTYQRAQTFAAMLRHSECLDFAQQAIRHARNVVEEGKALVLAIRTLTLLTRYDEAIDACVDFCNRLTPDAKLSKHPGLANVVGDVISISRQIQRVGVDAILSRLNELEDLRRDLLYEILSATADAAFVARPMLFSKLPRLGIHHLIREGASSSCQGSVFHVFFLATIVLGAAGRVSLALEVGKAARQRIDSIPFETRYRALFIVETFLRHLDEPLRASPPMSLAAASHSQKVRDTAYEGYCLYNRAFALDWLGEPLDQMIAIYQDLSRSPAVASSEDLSDWIRVSQRLCTALQGQGNPAGQLETEAVRSKTANAVRCTVRLRGAALGIWPGPYRAADYGFPGLLTVSMGLGGLFSENIVHFHAGLIYLAALRKRLPLLERLHFRAAAAFVTHNVRVRARYNPTDYSHRVALLDAEHLRNRRQFKDAMLLYENAAHLAQTNGWLNEAALVLEKFSEMLIELDELERARTTVDQSITLYRRWQAWAKVEEMERMAQALRDRKEECKS